ncbi:MAG: nucleoside triphosphate pyrophosphatase [Thiohalocapsa sp.]|jgi:septum formation protein|uniref:Maf family protein n=1 Tax=Thiohalocapsa sp. TaxID=2497641 RepID=UPI0025D31362|nr:nucleoside triphosphate pyrophosphatase [Thiohalocapsa sp.]
MTSSAGAPAPPLILASNSPRRRALLAQIGVNVAVRSADMDETPLPGEAAADYVLRMALSKARAVHVRLAEASDQGTPVPVLGADTAVICDDHILGKPTDVQDGARMLALLSGRTHQVLTAVALLGSRERTALSETQVAFRDIGEAEAAAYWATGEPRDKAGGYAVQGLGAVFVSSINGSWSGVVGLPLFETAALLSAEGIDVLATPARNVPR